MTGRDPQSIAAQSGQVGPSVTFSVYQQVATRRYIDDQIMSGLIRFAAEPAERVPSCQLTREDRYPAVEPGEFDCEVERLTGPNRDE